MTNFDKITESIDAFIGWWGGSIRCGGCPLELSCEDTAHCEKAVKEYLTTGVDEYRSKGVCDFGR